MTSQVSTGSTWAQQETALPKTLSYITHPPPFSAMMDWLWLSSADAAPPRVGFTNIKSNSES